MRKIGDSYDEITLLKRVMDGDEFAFRVIFNTHNSYVLYFGEKFLKSQATAEDLVQEAFTSL